VGHQLIVRELSRGGKEKSSDTRQHGSGPRRAHGLGRSTPEAKTPGVSPVLCPGSDDFFRLYSAGVL